mmetsp:Transcript_30142/g.69353  ORF Transcript_30142/g.69353 Transcript_30142/m.69353 type:complete len:473 (+) Transcript_30142:1-1419(+)
MEGETPMAQSVAPASSAPSPTRPLPPPAPLASFTVYVQAREATVCLLLEAVEVEPPSLAKTWLTVEAIDSALQQHAAELQCSSIQLKGEGTKKDLGPLHIVATAKDVHEKTPAASTWSEQLQKKLLDVLQRTAKRLNPERLPKPAAEPETARPASNVAAEPDDPPTGTVLVQGFPDSWSEAQLRVVFSIHGGLSKVRMLPPSRDPATGKKVREAQATLKCLSKVAQAIESLNNVEVGDGELVETAVVKVSMCSGGAEPIVTRTLFLDELPMPRRPRVAPRTTDREIWVTGLPAQVQDPDRAMEWLQTYGAVDDVFLVRHEGEVVKGCYVRFATHDDAQQFVTDALQREAKELRIAWSEAERAMDGEMSVYGADLLTMMRNVAKQLPSGKAWVLGESSLLADPSAPPATSKQLHLCITSNQAQFQTVKDGLADHLSKVHAEAKRLQQLIHEIKEWNKARKALGDKPRLGTITL